MRYSTLVLSTEQGGQYESRFIHIPLTNNQTTKKLSDNVIVRITSSDGFQIELFFKNATNVIISGVDYCGTTLTPTLMLNTSSETYNDVNATVLPTNGNVSQPFDEGYDRLYERILKHESRRI